MGWISRRIEVEGTLRCYIIITTTLVALAQPVGHRHDDGGSDRDGEDVSDGGSGGDGGGGDLVELRAHLWSRQMWKRANLSQELSRQTAARRPS